MILFVTLKQDKQHGKIAIVVEINFLTIFSLVLSKHLDMIAIPAVTHLFRKTIEACSVEAVQTYISCAYPDIGVPVF